MNIPDELLAHRGPFRQRYLLHDEVEAQLRAWAEAYPHITRLRSLGRSPQNRELWMLTVGSQPDESRPAVWVDGNMHAGEVAGSNVALAVAEMALAAQLAEPNPNDTMVEALKSALFYIMPRISPDGAEAMLTTGQYVRSVPRDGPVATQRPRWITRDMDGDGLALLMRAPDPNGDFVEHPDAPGLMVPRELEDAPPFYRVWPEGEIENYDGWSIPDPDFLSDNSPDLNRNFAWNWQGEHKQKGAGPHPGSEPESRAVMEFAASAPNIVVWANLHTFGGVFIRPPGDVSDADFDQGDLALYRQLEAWGRQECNYPMVSGYDEFLYTPKQPVRGALAEWAYSERGCLAWVTELWDLFARLEVKTPPRFVDYYTRLTRGDLLKLYRWDRAENKSRIFVPWRSVEHPQLGHVEVGGYDGRVGVSNPPLEEIDRLCDQHARFLMKAAAILPRVSIAPPTIAPRGDAFDVSITVTNHGYLPTHGTYDAKSKPFNEPLWMELELGEGLHCPGPLRIEIGHLDGWGRGRFNPSQAIFFMRSQGNSHQGQVRWTFNGQGSATVRVGSARVGWISRSFEMKKS